MMRTDDDLLPVPLSSISASSFSLSYRSLSIKQRKFVLKAFCVTYDSPTCDLIEASDMRTQAGWDVTKERAPKERHLIFVITFHITTRAPKSGNHTMYDLTNSPTVITPSLLPPSLKRN
ncbi:hypothetical protein GQX73_g2062 [Xylaria multiplex]|uniref:Uncharacterized protein n=1 Tax=Xylaria multiplex TaxID=323545 RepID=A0A7C8MYQ2_9PEZI|nr:hypothetical protein GQX73_g2062 [Xylaria multiplex]